MRWAAEKRKDRAFDKVSRRSHSGRVGKSRGRKIVQFVNLEMASLILVASAGIKEYLSVIPVEAAVDKSIAARVSDDFVVDAYRCCAVRQRG